MEKHTLQIQRIKYEDIVDGKYDIISFDGQRAEAAFRPECTIPNLPPKELDYNLPLFGEQFGYYSAQEVESKSNGKLVVIPTFRVSNISVEQQQKPSIVLPIFAKE